MPSSGIATDVESPFGFNVDRRNVDRRVATKLWHSDCQRWIASRATGNGDRAGARWRDERGEGWHERRGYHGAMSPPRTFFSGMEETIERIVGFFRHAAQGLEERKQVLYLLGPVGGGKSSLAERLKQLMEKEPVHVLKA